MRRLLITILASIVGLASSAAPAGAGLFSATGAVIAILAGNLFVGEAEGHLSGAGTLAIHSQSNPNLTCRGQFPSSDDHGGSGQMQCSDGATATFQFQRLTVFRGHGAGSTSLGPLTFAYGLSAEEAGPYLKLPEGKRLASSGTELALVDL